MAYSHGASIVTDNLVLMLDAANPRSYPGGLTWNDLSGNGNNATWPAGVVYQGNNQGYFQFGGTQYATSPLTQTNVTAYSICLWFNTTNTTASMTFIGGNTQPSLAIGINSGIGGSSTGNIWFVIIGAGVTIGIFTNSTYNDGRWHCVTGVFNQPSGSITPSNFTLYVDGFPVTRTGTTYGSASVPITQPGSGTTRISSVPNTSGYIGYMSSFLVYNSALTSTQAAQNFEAYRGRYGV